MQTIINHHGEQLYPQGILSIFSYILHEGFCFSFLSSCFFFIFSFHSFLKGKYSIRNTACKYRNLIVLLFLLAGSLPVCVKLACVYDGTVNIRNVVSFVLQLANRDSTNRYLMRRIDRYMNIVIASCTNRYTNFEVSQSFCLITLFLSILTLDYVQDAPDILYNYIHTQQCFNSVSKL